LSLVKTLFSIALPVSAAVQPRTAQKVYLHFLSEFGELAEEINIAAGELYKEAGPDGVMGEAADVMNCLSDFLWITSKDDERFYEFCAAVAKYADLEDFDDQRKWPDFEQSKREFIQCSSDFHLLCDMTEGHYALDSIHAQQTIGGIIHDVMVMAKAANPLMTSQDFIDVFTAKCEKWRAKAS